MPINRYRQLLAGIPTGSFYKSEGQILPYRNFPYQIRLTASTANQEYHITVNSEFKGSVVSDVNKIALMTVQLDKGDNELRITNPFNTQDTAVAFITTRDYATWLASVAEVMEVLDTGLEQIKDDSRIGTVGLERIETVFGRTVGTPNNPSYALEVYRELLQEIRTAYRYYGSTVEGFNKVVAAFTHVNPLLYPRSFGPEWVLGNDIVARHADASQRSLYTTAALPNIQAGGAVVEITGIDSRFDNDTLALNWGGGFALSLDVGAEPANQVTTVAADGDYTVYGPRWFNPIIGEPESYDITLNGNDQLTLDIDNKGIIDITLTAGAGRTAAQIAADINAALNADARYGVVYNTVADSHDISGGGGGVPRIRLTAPNLVSTSNIIIYNRASSRDAAQTLFNMPLVRGGLNAAQFIGDLVLTLNAATDMDPWPFADTENPLKVVVGRTTFYPSGGIGGAGVAIDPELVSVVAVDKGAKTLTLAAPGLVNNQAGEALVELENQLPYQRSAVSDTRYLNVKITNSGALPGAPTVDAITLVGSGLTPGWLATDYAGAVPPSTVLSTKSVYFNQERDCAFVMLGFPTPLNTEGHDVTIPVGEEILLYKGFNALFTVWGSIDDPTYSAPLIDIDTIDLSFDNMATWSSAAPTKVGTYCSASWRPNEYYRLVQVPANATKVWMRIKLTQATNGNFIVQRVRVTIPTSHGGLFLGDGTTPRNEMRIKQGYFTYVWSRDALTAAEDSLIGTSTTQWNGGHMDTISPANMWLEKFDVSEYAGLVPKNIKGVFIDTDFVAGISTNLSMILRSPNRFTHLKPSIASQQIETVVFDPANKATLTYTADQIDATAYLSEDDIPVTQDTWQWNSGTEIEVTAFAPDPLKTYTFVYNALHRFESDTIDTAATFADYLWFADWHVFARPEIEAQSVQVTTGLQFDGNGVARLPDVSDGDKSTGTLLEDTGLTKRIVLQTDWDYQDSERIVVSQTVFNANSLYTFTYNAQVNHPKTDVTVKVELKSAAAPAGLGAAVYSEVTQNQVIGNTYRYHKMRITVSGIRDSRDIRIYSLVLKGLPLFGSTTCPILNP